jgi:hypothetical protein
MRAHELYKVTGEQYVSYSFSSCCSLPDVKTVVRRIVAFAVLYDKYIPRAPDHVGGTPSGGGHPVQTGHPGDECPGLEDGA